MGIQVHNISDNIPAEQVPEETSKWEGQEVSKKPTDIETTKKSKTVFGKMKDFMKAAWRHKYKILLATLGVVTLGGATAIIARKVNQKSLTTIKPDTKSEQDKISEDNALEIKQESGPKSDDFPIDLPVDEGIGSLTPDTLHEEIVPQEEERIETEEVQIQEEATSTEKKTNTQKLSHPTLDRPSRKGVRPPTRFVKLYEKLISEEEVNNQKKKGSEDSEDVNLKVDEQPHIEEDQDSQSELLQSKFFEAMIAVEEEELNEALARSLEEEDEQLVEVEEFFEEPDSTQLFEALKTESNEEEKRHVENRLSTSSPSRSHVQKKQTKAQKKAEEKLTKKMNKYRKKLASHPRNPSKYNQVISLLQHRLDTVRG
ncbi:MAG: hypothetical protein AAGG81_01320 [Chlamydiota bacterium]